MHLLFNECLFACFYRFVSGIFHYNSSPATSLWLICSRKLSFNVLFLFVRRPISAIHKIFCCPFTLHYMASQNPAFTGSVLPCSITNVTYVLHPSPLIHVSYILQMDFCTISTVLKLPEASHINEHMTPQMSATVCSWPMKLPQQNDLTANPLVSYLHPILSRLMVPPFQNICQVFNCHSHLTLRSYLLSPVHLSINRHLRLNVLAVHILPPCLVVIFLSVFLFVHSM